jgi:hypothetical protein
VKRGACSDNSFGTWIELVYQSKNTIILPNQLRNVHKTFMNAGPTKASTVAKKDFVQYIPNSFQACVNVHNCYHQPKSNSPRNGST